MNNRDQTDSSANADRSPLLGDHRRERERARSLDAIEATFPAPNAASPDELVQMAIHALGFDASGLAASLGLARSEGEALIRSPGTLSRRHRALLAQYLEMGGDTRAAPRNRAIAAKLRESLSPEAPGGRSD